MMVVEGGAGEMPKNAFIIRHGTLGGQTMTDEIIAAHDQPLQAVLLGSHDHFGKIGNYSGTTSMISVG